MSEPRFDLGQLVFHHDINGVEDHRYFQVVRIDPSQEAGKPMYLIRGFQHGPQMLVPEDQLRAATSLGERAARTTRERNAASPNVEDVGAREGREAAKPWASKGRAAKRGLVKRKSPQMRRKVPRT